MNIQVQNPIGVATFNEIPSDPWRDFEDGNWTREIDVRDFIQKNVTPWIGDAAFLVPATARTQALWTKLKDL
ncbi:pyruvate-formate lyase, partial [Rhodopseudomonas rhenobacensis]